MTTRRLVILLVVMAGCGMAGCGKPAAGPAPAPQQTAASAPSAAEAPTAPAAPKPMATEPVATARTKPSPPPRDEVEEPWVRPLPAGFVRMPSPWQAERTVSKTCHGLTVTNVFNRDGGESFVRVTHASGRKIYEAHGRKYGFEPGERDLTMYLWVDYCGDLTGDGVPEIVMTERTMGAHCCYTHYAVSMTSPQKRLLMWNKGDAGTGIWPVKAKAGSSYQLYSTVVTWPPFDPNTGEPVMSYAHAPLLPMIFQLEGDSYRARTFRFGRFLRNERAIADTRCRDNPQCDPSDWLLVDWGTALIIGDWSQRKKRWQDPQLASSVQAMDRHSAAWQRKLKKQLGI